MSDTAKLDITENWDEIKEYSIALRRICDLEGYKNAFVLPYIRDLQALDSVKLAIAMRRDISPRSLNSSLFPHRAEGYGDPLYYTIDRSVMGYQLLLFDGIYERTNEFHQRSLQFSDEAKFLLELARTCLHHNAYLPDRALSYLYHYCEFSLHSSTFSMIFRDTDVWTDAMYNAFFTEAVRLLYVRNKIEAPEAYTLTQEIARRRYTPSSGRWAFARDILICVHTPGGNGWKFCVQRVGNIREISIPDTSVRDDTDPKAPDLSPKEETPSCEDSDTPNVITLKNIRVPMTFTPEDLPNMPEILQQAPHFAPAKEEADTDPTAKTPTHKTPSPKKVVRRKPARRRIH